MPRLKLFTPQLTEAKLLILEEQRKIIEWIETTRDLVDTARARTRRFGRESHQTTAANQALFRQFMRGDEAAIQAIFAEMSLADQDVAIAEIETLMEKFVQKASRLYRRSRQATRN